MPALHWLPAASGWDPQGTQDVGSVGHLPTCAALAGPWALLLGSEIRKLRAWLRAVDTQLCSGRAGGYSSLEQGTVFLQEQGGPSSLRRCSTRGPLPGQPRRAEGVKGRIDLLPQPWTDAEFEM